MNPVFRMIGAAAFLSIGAIYGFQADKKVQAKYNISEPEKDFMDKCKNTMSRENLSFAEGARTSSGCACMTKTLLSQVDTEDLPAVQAYLKFTMKTRSDMENNDVDLEALQALERNITAINETYRISEVQAMTYFNTIGEAIMTCGDRKNHTSENIATWAALMPKSHHAKMAQSNPSRPTPKTSPAPAPKKQDMPPPKLRGLSNG